MDRATKLDQSITTKKTSSKVSNAMESTIIEDIVLSLNHDKSCYCEDCDGKRFTANLSHVVRVSWAELQVGKNLGSGGYCSVRNASLVNRRESEWSYAIKVIKPEVSVDDEAYQIASDDLDNEAKILSTLSHQNIIKLAAVVNEDEKEFNNFIVVDKLVNTLSRRLSRLRNEHRTKQTSLKAIISSNDNKMGLRNRLKDIALGIANGVQYLHSKGIMHRDLKPDNIGFNELEEPVIFDFGFACKVPTQEESWQYSCESLILSSSADESSVDTHTALIKSDGPVGTPRYWAPEVARDESYGLSADVYSFAIILWEIATMQFPFANLQRRGELQEKVVLEGQRPPLKVIKSASLRKLLNQSWDDVPNCRPNISRIRRRIEDIVDEMADSSSNSKQFLRLRRSKGREGIVGRPIGFFKKQVSGSSAKRQLCATTA